MRSSSFTGTIFLITEHCSFINIAYPYQHLGCFFGPIDSNGIEGFFFIRQNDLDF